MAYTLEQVRQAYRAAVAAGNADDAERILMVALKLAQSQAPDERGLYDPTEGRSFGQNLREGIGRGLVNTTRHAGNLANLVPDERIEDANRLDAPLMATGGGKVGNILGEAAATAPLGLGVGSAASRLGGVAARVAANPVGRGALEGAAQGLLMADPGDKAGAALVSGAIGAALPGMQAAGGKLMRGVTRTAEAEALLRQGVDLTPGQMNPRGMFNQFEESLTSVNIPGNPVRAARDNAMNDWQRLVVQEGAPAGTTIAKDTSPKMLAQAYDAYGPAYAAGKGFPVGAKIMNNPGADVPLNAAFGQAGQRSRFGLLPEQRANMVTTAQEHLQELINRARQTGTPLQSDDLLKYRSWLRREARGLGDAPADRAQREMLAALEQKVTAALDSQLPPDAMASLRAADTQYGTYKIVEDAVRRAGDQASGLTPAKLEQAIRAATDDGTFARGGGRLRDIERQGAAVFERVSPPTGARLASLGIPAAAVWHNPAVGAPLAAGALGLVATRTGRRAAAGMTLPQQRAQVLAEAMRRQVPDYARALGNEYAQRLLVATGGY